MLGPLTLVLLLLTVAPAEAQTVLRMAAIAPEGTAWARQLRALSRNVESATHDRVRMKWYFGGIAGDERKVVDRIRRDQLDGEAGAMFCSDLAPSLKVLRIVGLIHSREEISYVVARLRKDLDTELAKEGFVLLSEASFGMDLLFTRHPITDFETMRKTPLWVWDADEVMREFAQRAGLNAVVLPLDQAAHAYDTGRIDGYIAIPSAMLAFQFSARVGYFSQLDLSSLPGCMVLARRALDRLSIEDQTALRDVSARFGVLFEQVGRAQDDQLLSQLFEKQGVKRFPVSEQLRSQFYEVARRLRDTTASSVVPRELLSRAQSWLADYRVEHPSAPR